MTKAVACNDTVRKSHSHDCFHGRAPFAHVLLSAHAERLVKNGGGSSRPLHALLQEELNDYLRRGETAHHGAAQNGDEGVRG
jgi:hypothetical protein